jgi:asparagine synthase (glutamine-hydrolysing)
MCGITGYLSDDPRARAALPAMTAALAHRGPDADGFHFDGPVGLGHRRLSVIDIAGSRQPLVSADGGVAVVFNGEIYNFRALRRELAASGHVFRTNGDGEVLVHGWKTWGPRMLDRLAGMFAFALWDRERRELFLARDHLVVTPL